jgi:maltose alpha-D-glucosyltransferase/alpha-amylase
MHALLASERMDPVFTPEPIVQQDLVRWSGIGEALLGSVLQGLPSRLGTLNENARVQAQRLIGARMHLSERIVELTRMRPDALKIRHHGNLHLSKVLLAADDFLITGFEGDASLPLEARRRKDSALGDLASLLNSLEYARVAALERATVARPEQRERLQTALAEWLKSANAALLTGYDHGVGTSRCVPSDRADLMKLVRLFRMIRSLHAAYNELNSRAPWTGVPLEVLSDEVM